MFCPFKYVDPSAHNSFECEPNCAWRAAFIQGETEDSFTVSYYCGLVNNSTRIEIVNLDGPVQIPKRPQVEMMEAPEESGEDFGDEGLA